MSGTVRGFVAAVLGALRLRGSPKQAGVRCRGHHPAPAATTEGRPTARERHPSPWRGHHRACTATRRPPAKA
jgi:hypothetical protein